MKFLRYSGVAFESIMANKMRSISTMLGLIIGVASVLTTIGIGRGAAEGVSSQIEGQGINTLSINPKTENLTDNSTLTSGDAKALADKTLHPEIMGVAPTNSSFVRVVFYGNAGIESQVTGATAAYASVRSVKIAQGRFFSAAEEADQARVAVLSTIAARSLFKNQNPVGQMVRIKNEPFQVIGVLKPSSGDDSESYFRPVYVPIDVAQTHLINGDRYRGEYTVSEITVQVASKEMLPLAEQRIEQTLRIRHNLEAKDKNDFHILDQAKLLELAGNISSMMTYLLGSIGGVSLLVGGIGIMNIMLVSVTERTSEIGLRKALGAQERDILLQFLIEAMVLCAFGSMIGIGLSYSVSYGLNHIPNFPFKILIEPAALMLALGVGLFSGFVFGLYPAFRATRLDPIEALRHE